MDAAMLYQARHLDNLSDITFICDGTSCKSDDEILEFTGEVPKSGSITITKKSISSVEFLSNGKYCASGTKDNLLVSDNCMSTYLVKHYQMDLDSVNYTLVETETFSGKLNTTVTPNVKEYKGFKSPSKENLELNSASEEISYYYERNQYSVIINKGVGITSVTGEGTYYYGETIELNASVDVGYNWSKWDGTFETSAQNYFFVIEGDVEIDAVASPKTYILTYNNNGGSGCTTKNGIFGQSWGSLCVPEMSGYTFNGWFTGKTDGTQITSETIVTDNIDVFAQWTKNTDNWTLTIPITYSIGNSDGNGSASGNTNIIIKCVDDVITLSSGHGTGNKCTRSWTTRGYYYSISGTVSGGTPSLSYTGSIPKNFTITLNFSGYIVHTESGTYNLINYGKTGSGSIILNYTNGSFSYTRSSINICSYGQSTTSDPDTVTNDFVINGVSLYSKIG